MIAWVAQDTHLFNTTIRANIALGRPEASEDEIGEAARAAQLGELIDSLPDGLDTAGRRAGCAALGGQRQRLALARRSWPGRPSSSSTSPPPASTRRPPNGSLDDLISASTGVRACSM